MSHKPDGPSSVSIADQEIRGEMAVVRRTTHMTTCETVFGSIDNYVKGGVEVIDNDPRNYVFSNMFEVAANSAPYERTATMT